ncbi:hypothetical protein Vi05172_g2826 [Venturia inaequalis]|nr:hypothetical protein Vi05172_g2826 [Venturia inaequalis]
MHLGEPDSATDTGMPYIATVANRDTCSTTDFSDWPSVGHEYCEAAGNCRTSVLLEHGVVGTSTHNTNTNNNTVKVAGSAEPESYIFRRQCVEQSQLLRLASVREQTELRETQSHRIKVP